MKEDHEDLRNHQNWTSTEIEVVEEKLTPEELASSKRLTKELTVLLYLICLAVLGFIIKFADSSDYLKFVGVTGAAFLIGLLLLGVGHVLKTKEYRKLRRGIDAMNADLKEKAVFDKPVDYYQKWFRAEFGHSKSIITDKKLKKVRFTHNNGKTDVVIPLGYQYIFGLSGLVIKSYYSLARKNGHLKSNIFNSVLNVMKKGKNIVYLSWIKKLGSVIISLSVFSFLIGSVVHASGLSLPTFNTTSQNAMVSNQEPSSANTTTAQAPEGDDYCGADTNNSCSNNSCSNNSGTTNTVDSSKPSSSEVSITLTAEQKTRLNSVVKEAVEKEKQYNSTDDLDTKLALLKDIIRLREEAVQLKPRQESLKLLANSYDQLATLDKENAKEDYQKSIEYLNRAFTTKGPLSNAVLQRDLASKYNRVAQLESDETSRLASYEKALGYYEQYFKESKGKFSDNYYAGICYYKTGSLVDSKESITYLLKSTERVKTALTRPQATDKNKYYGHVLLHDVYVSLAGEVKKYGQIEGTKTKEEYLDLAEKEKELAQEFK